jgi:hypothetical protein
MAFTLCAVLGLMVLHQTQARVLVGAIRFASLQVMKLISDGMLGMDLLRETTASLARL